MKFFIDETAASIVAPVVDNYPDCIFLLFYLNLYILFIVTQAELGLSLITYGISAVNWLVDRVQLLIVQFLDILKIFLLLNLSVIFFDVEGGDESAKVLLACLPIQSTDTFYD